MTIELKHGAVMVGARPIASARASEQGRDRQRVVPPRFLTFSFEASPPAHSNPLVRVKQVGRWFGLSCATAGVVFFLLLVAIGVLLFNAFSVPVGNRGWPAASHARRG